MPLPPASSASDRAYTTRWDAAPNSRFFPFIREFRRDLNRVRHAGGHLGRDDRRAGAAEWFVDRLPGRGIVLDRPAHALDRLLRRVAGLRHPRPVNLPQRRLFPVAGPMSGATVAHGIKARLMLSVVVTAADDQLAFGPNDPRADGRCSPA